MKKNLFIIFLFLFNILSFSEKVSENLKVTFISPNTPGNIFWDKVTNYMKIAAEDLEIDLEVKYPPKSHRLESKKLAEKVLNSSEKPDYLLYLYPAQVGEHVLKLAEAREVKSFIFNTDIPAIEKASVSNVNEKYKGWMGHIYPDDFDAGYKLGKELIKEAEKKNLRGKDGKIHIIALSGSHDSNAAEDRNAGLQKAVMESKDVVIDQTVYVYWDPKKAFQTSMNLFKRYPDASVVWGASDGIALGAMKAARTSGKLPGVNMLFGGVDWSQEGIEAVKAGEMTATVGGHALEGVTSLLLIKDHSMGENTDYSKYPVKTGMEVINGENVEAFEAALSFEEFEKLDIRKYSKYYNEELEEFNFNLLETMDIN